jgi:hypothetical protein
MTSSFVFFRDIHSGADLTQNLRERFELFVGFSVRQHNGV